MSSTASNFFLIDCNQFFVSCEQLFNPKLHNKPVVVLSSNDGCVVARSKEAKALNIPMGAPAYQYEKLFKQHGVFALSSNFALYSDISRRVMEVLHHFGDAMEEYSIDEAFLQLESPDPIKTATAIRATVLKWVGIPVSIGIGNTKTLAKLASDLSKNTLTGVFSLLSENTKQEVFSTLPVQEIWGIGSKTAKELASCRIRTASDLIHSDDFFIKKRFSITLYRVFLELKGTSCLTLSEINPAKQSITRSRSFANPTFELTHLEEALSSHVFEAAVKLRQDGQVAHHITCFLMTSRFIPNPYSNSACLSVPEASAYTPLLIEYAKKGLRTLFRPNLPYKKVGIILSELSPASEKQLDLLEPSISPKKEAAIKLMDNINKSFGKGSLSLGALGTSSHYQSKQEHASPRYTTSWEELLTIDLG